jgi:hypothetical protein
LIRKTLLRVHKTNNKIGRNLILGSSIIGDMGVKIVLGYFVWLVLVVYYCVAYVFGLLPERSQSAIMTLGCSPSRPSPFMVETRAIVHIVQISVFSNKCL